VSFRFFPVQRTLTGGLKWETPPIIEWLANKAGSKVVGALTIYSLGASGIKEIINPANAKGLKGGMSYDLSNMPYGRYSRAYRPYRRFRPYYYRSRRRY
jgi:hypothetical protein